MREPLACVLQTPLVPTRIARRAEEIGPHVVVYAVDIPTQCIEMLAHLRADQSAGPGDENFQGRLLLGYLLENGTNHPRRVSPDDGARCYVFRNHGARANDGAVADRYTFENQSPCADETSLPT